MSIGSGVGIPYRLRQIAALTPAGGHLLAWDDVGETWVARALLSGDIPDLSSAYAAAGHHHDATYAPVSHAHAASAITSGTLDAARIPDLSSTYAAAGHNHDSAYAPASHTHAASAITSGTLDAARIPDLSGTYAVVGHTHTGGSGDVVTTPTASADNRIISQGASVVPITLRGHASQTAALTEWQASSGAVLGSVAASGQALHIVSDAVTNTVSDGLIVDHVSSGTPANDFGTALRLRGQSSTTTGRDMALIQASWNNVTDASRRSTLTLGSFDGTTYRTRLILRSGANPQIELLVTSGELFACRGESGHQLITWYAGYGGGNQYGEINVNQLSTTRARISAWDTCFINPQNTGAGLAVGQTTATSKLDVAGDMEMGDADALYFGDPTTNGTWRITRSGTGLVIQRRESGSYVTKSTIAA